MTAPATIGHNNPPAPTPYELIRDEIEDLFGEARNWCDGEPIASQAVHDEVERLYDLLSEAGKRAEVARVDEKKPLDDAVAEIQTRYGKLIGNTKSVKGKVVLGKDALGALLTPWRNKVAAEREAVARNAREEADRIAAEAQAAIRASAGNLEEREKAEDLLQEAKAVERGAKRADKQATTGTGLRTIWKATMEDEEKAMEWGWERDPAAFRGLVQSMADSALRGGLRAVPGFQVENERVAV